MKKKREKINGCVFIYGLPSCVSIYGNNWDGFTQKMFKTAINRKKFVKHLKKCPVDALRNVKIEKT